MTEVTTARKEGQREREIRYYDAENMSPIEHLFIGSTPFRHDDPEKVDIRTLLAEAVKGDSKALDKLTTPISLQKRKQSLRHVREDRDFEKERKTRIGGIVICEDEWQIQLNLRQGKTLWVEPSELDELGRNKGGWKIWIIDEKKKELVQDAESIEELRLKKEFSAWFKLHSVKGKPCKLLKLNIDH